MRSILPIDIKYYMHVIGKKNKVNLMLLVTLASLTEREVAVSVESSSDGQPHLDVL